MAQTAGTVTVRVRRAGSTEVTAPSIPVGATTIAGTSVSLVAFVLAILAAVTGHGTTQDTEVIVAGATGLATASITLIGRYLQAHAALMIAASVASVVERERRLHPERSFTP